MNGPKQLSIFVRLISRSCVRQKVPLKNAANPKLKLGETPVVPVEKDTHRLANYVCGTNLFVERGEDIKLKPDSEYPEWLWKITPALPLAELDPNTKAYWNRVRKIREKDIKFQRSLQKNTWVHK